MFETPGLYKISGVSSYPQNLTDILQNTQYIDSIAACPVSGIDASLDVYVLEFNDLTPYESLKTYICLGYVAKSGHSTSILQGEIVLPPGNIIVAKTDRSDIKVDFLVSYRVINEV